jgi:hypothetical protein
MARPKVYKEDRPVLAVRIPTALRARLDRVATERHITKTFLVVQAVNELLERLDREEQQPRFDFGAWDELPKASSSGRPVA